MNTTTTHVTNDEFHRYKIELLKPDTNEYVCLNKDQKRIWDVRKKKRDYLWVTEGTVIEGKHARMLVIFDILIWVVVIWVCSFCKNSSSCTDTICTLFSMRAMCWLNIKFIR